MRGFIFLKRGLAGVNEMRKGGGVFLFPPVFCVVAPSLFVCSNHALVLLAMEAQLMPFFATDMNDNMKNAASKHLGLLCLFRNHQANSNIV